MLDVGLCAQVACVWEVTARKPGNVHRFKDFEDVSYLDFILSAAAIAPVMGEAVSRPVGETVLAAVRATRQVVQSNTNLGMVLLLAPLAAVPDGEDLRAGVERVLASLTVEDARLVYEAIRLAAPGGLGQASEQDVREEPTGTLSEVMALAAERDLVARQYANGFAQVFDESAPALEQGIRECGSLEGGIVYAQLVLLAQNGDTLIARKRGADEAEEVRVFALCALLEKWHFTARGRAVVAELDDWLREVGHERNPGTTADLVTAGLFVLLRQGRIAVPSGLPWATKLGEGEEREGRP
jgi:triphosphoribosyl-dephospho-CoA synthase